MTNLLDRTKPKQQAFTPMSLATVLSLPALLPVAATDRLISNQSIAQTPLSSSRPLYRNKLLTASTPTDRTEPLVGSLALSDLDELLLNQSPKLKQEIKQALQAVKKGDVGCIAPLFRRSFNELNNARIAPFTCFFAANKSLTIQAKTFAKLPDGKTLPLEQLLKFKTIPPGVFLQFELIDWKWTTANR